MSKILLVDDEKPLVDSLSYNLTKEGYTVLVAYDGTTAVTKAEQEKPDLIVLDLMLPQMSGLDVCRALREKHISTPIIMLTAKGTEVDRVVGLEIGADDYVTKPFSLRELIARIKAMLRRLSASSKPASDLMQIGDVAFNVPKHEASLKGAVLELSPKELELLKLLMSNAGKVLTRDTLLEAVWGIDFYGDAKTVDVHIRWLREKIEPDPGQPFYIKTVRGLGYRFEG
ncbi:MAG: response regulator transcription factor [Armatimonadetes bacterium]|nr:response regulator transcription factor [Armatimonadota bacterium]